MLVFCLLAGFGSAFAQSGQALSPGTRKLVVAVVHDPPMSMKDEKGEWRGFSVDMWRRIALNLGVSYAFREMPFRDVEGALGSGEADICISPVYETVDRLRTLDFSATIGATRLAIAVLPAKDVHPFVSALKIFLSWGVLEIAFLFLAVLLLTGLVFWLMERKHNPESFGGHPVKGIGTGIYWVGTTLVSGICTGVSLKSSLGRLTGLIWIVAGAIGFSALTASLASSLIEREQLLGFVYDVNAIRGMHLGVIRGATQEAILVRMGGNYTVFDETDKGVDALLKNRIDGFFGNERTMSYEGQRRKGKISIHPVVLRKMRFAFAFPQGSLLREDVNVALMKFMESREWDSLANRYGLTRDLEPLAKKGGKRGL